MIIRDAVIDDLETLILLCSKMHEESIEPYPLINRECMENYINMVVSNPDVFLISFAEDKSPIGMITAVAGPYSFSPSIRASSELLFVLPEHRGSRAAVKLVQRFKEWSDNIGAMNSSFGISTGVSPERTGRFFEHMGFRPIGMMYRRDNVYGI